VTTTWPSAIVERIAAALSEIAKGRDDGESERIQAGTKRVRELQRRGARQLSKLADYCGAE
jgi:hypothetical protein